MLKKTFKYFFIACFCLLTMTFSFAKTTATFPSGQLNATQAQEVINAYNSRLFIVDVRSVDEFNQGHLQKAVNIPIDRLENEMHKIPRGPVLIVCRTGRRAKIAWEAIHQKRPEQQKLWYFNGTISYGPNGTYSLH